MNCYELGWNENVSNGAMYLSVRTRGPVASKCVCCVAVTRTFSIVAFKISGVHITVITAVLQKCTILNTSYCYLLFVSLIFGQNFL